MIFFFFFFAFPWVNTDNFAFLLTPALPGKGAARMLPFLFEATLVRTAGRGPPLWPGLFPSSGALSHFSHLRESLFCGLAAPTENSGVCMVDRLPPVCTPGADSQAGFLATPKATDSCC